MHVATDTFMVVGTIGVVKAVPLFKFQRRGVFYFFYYSSHTILQTIYFLRGYRYIRCVKREAFYTIFLIFIKLKLIFISRLEQKLKL